MPYRGPVALSAAVGHAISSVFCPLFGLTVSRNMDEGQDFEKMVLPMRGCYFPLRQCYFPNVRWSGDTQHIRNIPTLSVHQPHQITSLLCSDSLAGNVPPMAKCSGSLSRSHAGTCRCVSLSCCLRLIVRRTLSSTKRTAVVLRFLTGAFLYLLSLPSRSAVSHVQRRSRRIRVSSWLLGSPNC